MSEAEVTLSEKAMIEKEWGLPLEELYKKAVKYYKESEGNGNLVVAYEDRLQFMAYSKQVKLGPYQDSHNDAGWFDFTGSDRIKAWQALGQLGRDEAMSGFVFLLDRVCPPFKQFVVDSIEAPKPRTDESELRVLNGHKIGQPGTHHEHPVDFQVYEAQRKQIQEALNAQTYHQFLAYAQQQIPGNPEQQEQLIKQLQEQHYQQYMSQVYAQHAQQGAGGDGDKPPRSADDEKAHDDDSDASDEEPGDDLPCPVTGTGARLSDPVMKDLNDIHITAASFITQPEAAVAGEQQQQQLSLTEHIQPESGPVLDYTPPQPANPNIAPASLWNRQDIVEFKDNIRAEGKEGCIKVGHGETVTVRVPTHEEGSCLFWEFATDHYDIGFGVLFEWSIADTDQVTVHVSESSDEELDEETEVAIGAEGGAASPRGTAPGDVESGTPRLVRNRDPSKPRQDEIIPVYRRDCHEEVYAGSHLYPGRGVYLLKFDNSYSLWRSKTLYYRVYYSR